MTMDLLDKLDTKINDLVESIELMQMEINELKEDKKSLSEKNYLLQSENVTLVAEQQQWQNRLTALVDKIDGAEDTI